MKPLGFSVINCIWKWSIFLPFVASYHTCLHTCLRHKTEGYQPFTNQPWSLIFSFPGEGSTACDFSAVPGPVWWAVWWAVWCAVRCAVDPDRYPPMLPSLMPLISMPHPLGGGSQNHPWQIRHGRTIYWWRRQPHHQKSNRHWDFMLPESLNALHEKQPLYAIGL